MDDIRDEAERVLVALWNTTMRDREAILDALERFAREQRATGAVDILPDVMMALVPILTDEQLGLANGALTAIQARLAPPDPARDESPAPKPDAGKKCPWWPPHDVPCHDCPKPVASPAPVTYRAGTVPDDLDYSQLDAGIRDAVRFVRSHGFVTTDSGDGSKFGAMDGALPFPHIVVRVEDEAMMGSEAERLHRLAQINLGPEWRAELSWGVGGPALVMLLCDGPGSDEALARYWTDPRGGDPLAAVASLSEDLGLYGPDCDSAGRPR
jgi:hypothetical protein